MAYNYKQEFHVPPPFKLYVAFVESIAGAAADSSFGTHTRKKQESQGQSRGQNRGQGQSNAFVTQNVQEVKSDSHSSGPAASHSVGGSGGSGVQKGQTNRKEPTCLYCQEQNLSDVKHEMAKCENFRKLSSNERLEVTNRVHGCWNCLKSKFHGKRECRAPRACAKPDCTRKHHTLLHDALEEQYKNSQEKDNQGNAS